MITYFPEVQDVIENYQSAVLEQDVEKFVSLYATNLHIYDCWADWECRSFSKWEEGTKKWFEGLKEEGVQLKVEMKDTVIEVDSSIAFIYSNVSFIAYNEAGEKLRQMTNRFTFGLKKEKDSWKIIHQHSSLPISMETGKGMFDLR